jgi:hypothetical protein
MYSEACRAIKLAARRGHEDVVDLLMESFDIKTLDGPQFGGIYAEATISGSPSMVSKVRGLRSPRMREFVAALVSAFGGGQREALESITRDHSIFKERDHLGMTALHALFSWAMNLLPPGWQEQLPDTLR